MYKFILIFLLLNSDVVHAFEFDKKSIEVEIQSDKPYYFENESAYFLGEINLIKFEDKYKKELLTIKELNSAITTSQFDRQISDQILSMSQKNKSLAV